MNINSPPLIRRVKIQCLVKHEKQGTRAQNATECSHDFVKTIEIYQTIIECSTPLKHMYCTTYN